MIHTIEIATTMIVAIIMIIPTTEINIEVDLNKLNLDFLIIASFFKDINIIVY